MPESFYADYTGSKIVPSIIYQTEGINAAGEEEMVNHDASADFGSYYKYQFCAESDTSCTTAVNAIEPGKYNLKIWITDETALVRT